MEIVVMVVQVAAALLVVYGGVLCLGQRLLAQRREPTARGREVGKGVLSYLSI